MNKVTGDNIFEDLGFPPAEAAILDRKAELMAELRKFIQTRRLNDTLASKKLGVTRETVLRLKNGEMKSFSIEQLLEMLARTGAQVRFVISSKKHVSAA